MSTIKKYIFSAIYCYYVMRLKSYRHRANFFGIKEGREVKRQEEKKVKKH
jgi:hypothetical protein